VTRPLASIGVMMTIIQMDQVPLDNLRNRLICRIGAEA
jgi:hypothetical protein